MGVRTLHAAAWATIWNNLMLKGRPLVGQWRMGGEEGPDDVPSDLAADLIWRGLERKRVVYLAGRTKGNNLEDRPWAYEGEDRPLVLTHEGPESMSCTYSRSGRWGKRERPA